MENFGLVASGLIPTSSELRKMNCSQYVRLCNCGRYQGLYIGDRKIGSACLSSLTKTTLLLCQVQVDKSFRNKSLGQLLVLWCLLEAKKRDYLFVKLDVANHNIGAIVCYQKCGFEKTASMFGKHRTEMSIHLDNENIKEIWQKYEKRLNEAEEEAKGGNPTGSSAC